MHLKELCGGGFRLGSGRYALLAAMRAPCGGCGLALYSIGSFARPGRPGIRFEHGSAVPAAPDGQLYQVCAAVRGLSHFAR